jgi:hypothetical protein
MFNINGVRTDSTTEGMKVTFAREFTTGWEKKEFKPVYGTVERDDNLREFIPVRKNMLSKTSRDTSVGPEIIPGQDLWEAPSNEDRNHRVSNWYFRIQFPVVVKPSKTSSVSMSL